MANFFRNTRKTLLGKNKIGKYFKYAIGEIFLVVIGILIAVQINNWNENRKTKAQLKAIFKTVQRDLQADTLLTSSVIRYYDTINKYSKRVIANQYNIKNIDSCLVCRSLLTSFNPLTIQKKGFKLLQNHTEFNTIESDSLVTDLSQFYNYFDPMITNNNEMVKSETLTNLNFFKKQKWFVPWMQGKMTDEMRLYFGESQDFKNRVAGNNIIATSNHQRFIILYKKGATKLLKVIEKRLEDN